MIKKTLFFIFTLTALATANGQKIKDSTILPNVKSRSELNNPEGMYAIWINKNSHLLNLPYIKGGQIVLQWADIEKGPGLYMIGHCLTHG